MADRGSPDFGLNGRGKGRLRRSRRERQRGHHRAITRAGRRSHRLFITGATVAISVRRHVGAHRRHLGFCANALDRTRLERRGHSHNGNQNEHLTSGFAPHEILIPACGTLIQGRHFTFACQNAQERPQVPRFIRFAPFNEHRPAARTIRAARAIPLPYGRQMSSHWCGQSSRPGTRLYCGHVANG